MQGLYIKKKEIDARGDRPPIDLLEKVKSLIGDLKAKKNRIENQKIQFATKFEKKRANLGDAALNSSSLAGLSSSIFKIKGIDKEVADLSMRMNKVEDMKATSRSPRTTCAGPWSAISWKSTRESSRWRRREVPAPTRRTS